MVIDMDNIIKIIMNGNMNDLNNELIIKYLQNIRICYDELDLIIKPVDKVSKEYISCYISIIEYALDYKNYNIVDSLIDIGYPLTDREKNLILLTYDHKLISKCFNIDLKLLENQNQNQSQSQTQNQHQINQIIEFEKRLYNYFTKNNNNNSAYNDILMSIHH
jgi:hypothetical protein